MNDDTEWLALLEAWERWAAGILASSVTEKWETDVDVLVAEWNET